MMAVEQRRPKPGLIHHSVKGILYSSGSYLALLKKYGMLRSMSGKGNCYDNAVQLRFDVRPDNFTAMPTRLATSPAGQLQSRY